MVIYDWQLREVVVYGCDKSISVLKYTPVTPHIHPAHWIHLIQSNTITHPEIRFHWKEKGLHLSKVSEYKLELVISVCRAKTCFCEQSSHLHNNETPLMFWSHIIMDFEIHSRNSPFREILLYLEFHILAVGMPWIREISFCHLNWMCVRLDVMGEMWFPTWTER